MTAPPLETSVQHAVLLTACLLLLSPAPVRAGSYQISASGSGQVQLWSNGDSLGSASLGTPAWTWSEAVTANPGWGVANRIRLTYTETYQYSWQPDFQGEEPVPHDAIVTADVFMPARLSSGGMDHSGQKSNHVTVGSTVVDTLATFTAPAGAETDVDTGTDYHTVSHVASMTGATGNFSVEYIAEINASVPYFLDEFRFSAGINYLQAAPIGGPRIAQVVYRPDENYTPLLPGDPAKFDVYCQNLNMLRAYFIKGWTQHNAVSVQETVSQTSFEYTSVGNATARVTWTPSQHGTYTLHFQLMEIQPDGKAKQVHGTERTFTVANKR